MDAQIAALFNLNKKNKDITANLYTGDDLSMGSVSPYGISSGIAELDLYLGGRGGFPAGKIVEFYGKPMCGKTTAALQAAAEWQKRGGIVAFVDSEVSFDPKRARELGVVVEDVLKFEVDTIEQLFETILGLFDDCVKAEIDKPLLVIADSVTGVPTLADVDGDIDKNDRPGYEAKQIKRGVKKVNQRLASLEARPTVIFINHSIAKIGGFGKKSDSGGGLGIKFFAAVRIEFIGIGNITDKAADKRIGQKVAIRIEKLKGAHLEFPSFNVELLNKGGFDRHESLKLAMCATGFAYRAKSSQVMTILPDTAHEDQIKQRDFQLWVDQHGGYDKVYLSWRKWCIKEKILDPWGGAGK
jgi:protein RecA